MKAAALTTAFLLALSTTGANGQQLETRPVPTGEVQSFTFQSPSMGVRFSLNVGMPSGYKPGDGKKYPALIVTDGDFAFPGVNEAARSLSGAITPLFIISVGTSIDEGEGEHTKRRIYEFSPPGWDRKDPFGQAVENYCRMFKSEEGRCSGGAGKFPIDTAQLGLFGLSAGGFFASWAIFQPNSPFKKYLISSPAMAYGRGEIFRQEARYAESHKDLPVGIYLAAGVLEAADPQLEGMGEIVSGMSHLA